MTDKPPITYEDAIDRAAKVASDTPVLIAGPTASGKSALALDIATRFGGRIINADALQVFDGWRIITARPSDDDLEMADHKLYGHVNFRNAYSVGHWLRDIRPLLRGARPIIVGGTGLYFQALTQGLADIPPTPKTIRTSADALSLDDLLSGLDGETRAAIDVRNRARVQRAWEVYRSTGRSLIQWRLGTPAPDIPLANALPLVLLPDVTWLNARIEKRFDLMLELGALDEAKAMVPEWNPDYLSSKAIGAPELIAHLRGQLSLAEARSSAIISSQQYGKRQRTWFRSKMKEWQPVTLG